jgi:predicted deacylase
LDYPDGTQESTQFRSLESTKTCDDVDDLTDQMTRFLSLDKCLPRRQYLSIQGVISEACDADYVFDVHCDDDSLVHIFTIPQQAENRQQLANWTGAVATLLAEDSGRSAFIG